MAVEGTKYSPEQSQSIEALYRQAAQNLGVTTQQPKVNNEEAFVVPPTVDQVIREFHQPEQQPVPIGPNITNVMNIPAPQLQNQQLDGAALAARQQAILEQTLQNSAQEGVPVVQQYQSSDNPQNQLQPPINTAEETSGFNILDMMLAFLPEPVSKFIQKVMGREVPEQMQAIGTAIDSEIAPVVARQQQELEAVQQQALVKHAGSVATLYETLSRKLAEFAQQVRTNPIQAFAGLLGSDVEKRQDSNRGRQRIT